MQSQKRSDYKLVKFGKYELTGKSLGKGNYSSVREAYDKEQNNKVVALKIVDLANNTDNYVKRNYQREAVLLQKLKHTNLTFIFDVLESTKYFVMVLEIMPQNLYEYVRYHQNSRLEEFYARKIFKQIASAIAYIHDMGVVHRDVKLENILYDRSKECAKLTGKIPTLLG